MDNLNTLAPERIMGELEKALLQADRPSIFFETLRKTDQLRHWFPELESLIGVEQSPVHHPEGDVWNHTMLVLDQAAWLRGGTEYRSTAATATSLEPDEGTVILTLDDRAVILAPDDRTVMLAPDNPLAFMLSALCHDLGKAVTTATGEDGRIHALGHETEGLAIAETMLRRLTNNRKLIQYVLNMTEHHMRPNILAGARSKKKSTNKMFDLSMDPEGLLLLARADYLGKGAEHYSREYEENYQPFLAERLTEYRQLMAQPHVTGKDLLDAGLTPGPAFREALAYAHKLRLSGITKEEALRQSLAYVRKMDFAGKGREDLEF